LAVIGAAESERKAESASAVEAIREGRLDYVAGWRYGVAHAQSLNKRAFRSLIVLEILGAMITGMGLYKAGFLTNQRPVKEYVRLALGGYAVSTPLVLISLWHMYRDGFSAAADARWMSIPYTTEVVGAVLANASVLLLLVRSGRLRWVFHPLSAVGRTAFSNYILTSLICKVVFSWGPWKLYGKLEFYQWYLFVAGIWTVNLIISPLWLRVFAFGPLEWLWRSLTYWKRQPLLRFE
jgi:uncharacterized protein